MKTTLFSPFQTNGLTLKNRFVLAPMCQYSANNGFANNWHLVHLGSRAVGGFGLIIQEATAVCPEGRISHKDLGLWDDAQIEFLQKITAFIKENNSIPGIQLAHAGRKASCEVPWKGSKQIKEGENSWQTVAPSAISFFESDNKPLALSIEGIEEVKNDFKMAAIRAVKAGYELIEIHSAHGYLLHQFLSPLSNFRTDTYGGSLENRMRLLLEITQLIREVIPSQMPLWIRISATDWKEGGWDVHQSIVLSKELKKLGVDLIDTSSGGLVSDAVIPIKPNYQVPFAADIRKEAQIFTGAVGLILNGKQAEEILQNHQADIILIGRAALRDAQFPLRAAFELDENIAWPLPYERGKFHS